MNRGMTMIALALLATPAWAAEAGHFEGQATFVVGNRFCPTQGPALKFDINQDGTVNSSDHPAKVGDFVSIWVTGVGFTQGVDGQMQTAPQTLCGCIIHDIVAGEDIFPAYAGAAPGMVTGVVQINFQVSSVATDGFTLSAGGRTSDPFTLHLTP